MLLAGTHHHNCSYMLIKLVTCMLLDNLLMIMSLRMYFPSYSQPSCSGIMLPVSRCSSGLFVDQNRAFMWT